ncbi:MAG: prephenate dehydrogenase/arogenate dehydrogenase family protein [Candidatus Methanoplasma sp.]|nr:prephenate dehydrogenase/arogenate dehydrogenase family protein [Candidatus Methanoplasma sp.]
MSSVTEEIRRTDREIIDLISKRTDLAEKIGRIKTGGGILARDRETEEEVVNIYRESSKRIRVGEDTLEQIARALIKEAADRKVSIAYPGRKKVSVVGGAGMMGRWMADLFSVSGCDVEIIDPASDNSLTLDSASGSDIVAVSVPIYAADSVLKELDGICGSDALIFDLTSLKTPVAETLTDMAERRKVCSIHPMFGPSAKSMFDRNLVICDCGCRQAVEEAASFFGVRGGNIRIMPIGRHDEYMSYVLGLSHAVNIAFFTVLGRSGIPYEDMRTVASTTFMKNMETNRSVASEDPRLYYDIQHLNNFRDTMWGMFSDAVEDIKKASLDGDPSEFIKIMDAGRKYFTRT